MNGIELLVEARSRDIGAFAVRRALPSMRRRRVGPFTFFDHMGPLVVGPRVSADVPPHPHIGLATVTYLFDGEIDHRDSVGSFQTIRPGDVNWMLAGRGIVHSERIAPEVRARGLRLHGIQSWVALPIEDELAEPRFEHHPARTIPQIELPGARLSVIAGTAYGARSPVGVLSPTLYVHALIEPGGRLRVDDEHAERAVYVVEGDLICDGAPLAAGTLAVLASGANVTLEARMHARVMLIGGEKLAGERFIDWNFVSSSKERIARAKEDWSNGRFSKIPHDDVEFVPLPAQRS